jgi:phosphotransferase system enzyme I (PtsP)
MAVRKDNVSLICDIGELSGLFEKSRDLNDFLQTVVSVVAYHMAAAVCSVYLYEEDEQELLLVANQGLNPAMVGTLRMKRGEGLVGLALKELRIIRDGNVSRNPFYKFIPGSDEERYQSFLAVPILRGLTRIGVLVVQDPQRDYFTENDQKALQAIAAQLATAIENARLFMSLYALEQNAPSDLASAGPAVGAPSFYKGVVGSGGFAWGRAAVLGRIDSYLRLSEAMARRVCSVGEFHEAFRKSVQQIESLQLELEENFADVASMIFSAHLLILKDSQFSGEMLRLMEEGRSPQQAITEVVNGYVAMFAKKTNPLFQEKVQDIKDVGHRLLHNLLTDSQISEDYRDEIVIAGELLPSDIVKLATQHAAGLIMVGTAVTSHISILARSMGMPVVLVDDEAIYQVPDGCRVLLDGNLGSVFFNPDDEIIQKYEESLAAHQDAAEIGATIRKESHTLDRVRVRLLANVNLLNELPLALRYKAEGIGLYRSEFPFIVRSGFPSEEEQFRIYRTLFKEMENRPVTLRTLDIGGDKMLSYFPTVSETNPFLGLRALRFTLQNKEIFVEQLRAMLRAGEGADLRIMFPLVASVDEFLQARDIVRECCEELARQGVGYNSEPKLGPMIELPSAVEVASELAQDADFLCVGTNDLVQYILAVDRTNESIAHYYVPHHPAVLRSLKRVADAGRKHQIPVSICGEMAGDPQMLPFLIGIGVRHLSMDIRRIPVVQAALRKINSRRAVRQAEVMLSMGRIADLTEFLQREATV